MKHLIIYTHPNPMSFNHAILTTIVEELQGHDQDIRVRDLYALGFDLCVKSTLHLIALGEAGDLPNRMMMTVHPQRWFDFGVKWCGELVNQNVKNVVKNVLIRLRNEK